MEKRANGAIDIDVCVISLYFKNYPEELEYLWIKRKDNEARQGLEPIGFSKKGI